MTRQAQFWRDNAERLNADRRKLFNYRKENGLCVKCGSHARLIKTSAGERFGNECESCHDLSESARKARKRDEKILIEKAKEAGL